MLAFTVGSMHLMLCNALFLTALLYSTVKYSVVSDCISSDVWDTISDSSCVLTSQMILCSRRKRKNVMCQRFLKLWYRILMYKAQLISHTAVLLFTVQSSQLLKTGISSVREIEMHCVRSLGPLICKTPKIWE
jgi:hypothetical protein